MAALARAIGKSAQHLTPYSTGKYKPGNELQEDLRKVGCDIEWLMTGISGSPSTAKTQISYWESRAGHFTDQERRDLDKFIKELLDEDNEVSRKNAMDVARIVLKQNKKKKE